MATPALFFRVEVEDLRVTDIVSILGMEKCIALSALQLYICIYRYTFENMTLVEE